MARHRRHSHGRRGGVRIGKWVSLGFKVLGATVAAGPAIQAIATQAGNPQQIPRQVLINYTGIDYQTGSWNSSNVWAGAGSIVGGVIIAKLGGVLGRMLR